MSIEILPLTHNYLSEVSSLHLTNLSTNFQGRAGKQLLRFYYGSLLTESGGRGFVAISGDRVAGFVCGVWDPDCVNKSLIRTRWLGILLWGVIQVINKPILFWNFINRLFSSSNGQTKHITGYELRPIVVHPDFRGKNVGVLLVNTLLEDARDRGYKEIFLIAEENNLGAVHFYKKFGFSMGDYLFDNNQQYIVFKKTV